jgi:hypothetical protein
LRLPVQEPLRGGQVGGSFVFKSRRGRKIKETALPSASNVLSIDWDKDSEMVAVLQENMNSVFLWNINQNKQENMDLDSSKAKATFAKWSKTHPVLAVGTDKVRALTKGELVVLQQEEPEEDPDHGEAQQAHHHGRLEPRRAPG